MKVCILPIVVRYAYSLAPGNSELQKKREGGAARGEGEVDGEKMDGDERFSLSLSLSSLSSIIN